MGPRLSRQDKEFFLELGYTESRIGKSLFFYLLVLGKIIDDKILWNSIINHIEALLKKYPFVKTSYMGFPKKWKEVLKSLTKA